MTFNPFIEEPDHFDRKIRGMWITGGGLTFHTHGEQGGQEGVWNGQGQIAGIWHAPVVTTSKTGSFQEGSTVKSVKWIHRDMLLGFHVIDTPGRGAEENESDFLGIFDYMPDEWDDAPEPTTLHVDTDISGHRRLNVLKYEAPVFEPPQDPFEHQYFHLIMKLRANQPFWYELDPATGKDHKTIFQSGSTDADGFIEVYNPTDRPIRQQWVLTRAQWTIPDVSWKGGKKRRVPGGVYKNRVIGMNPITAVQGGAVISLDNANHLMVRDAHYTNALPALLPQGQHFMHIIPPYTPKTMLPISYTGAPAGGARAELIQPRRWTRPYGGE